MKYSYENHLIYAKVYGEKDSNPHLETNNLKQQNN
jgi:hypothetical protein